MLYTLLCIIISIVIISMFAGIGIAVWIIVSAIKADKQATIEAEERRRESKARREKFDREHEEMKERIRRLK